MVRAERAGATWTYARSALAGHPRGARRLDTAEQEQINTTVRMLTPQVAAAGCQSAPGLSPGVEVSRPGVEGVELLSRGRGVECRGLSRPVEACRGLSRLIPCLPVSRGVEGCRGVSSVSSVSRVSRMSSGCRVCCQEASEVSRCPRWQDAVAAHQQNLGSSCKAVSSLSCSLSCTLLM